MTVPEARPVTGTRIRWEPTEPGSDDSFGYVGTVDRAMFTLWAPRRDDEAWEASSTLLPHQPGERYVGADADEAKGEAERWLEEFTTSLGAVFADGAGDSGGEAADPRPARRPVLTSMYVFDVLYSAGFTPWGNGEPGFTTGWYMDAITVDHVGADLPVHGPLEGPRAIIADYARTLFAAGFDTHITVNTVFVRKRAAAKTATAGEE